MKAIRFVDRSKIYVRAGNGGDGMASFRREKYIPRGGPNGGDGGRGGSVILVANPQIDNLLDLYHRPHQRAKNGERGGSQDCHGKSASDVEVPVPCGTLVWEEDHPEPLGELLHAGDRLCVARGGAGGLGNIHFASSTNQAPTKYTSGQEGEEKVLWLELKTVADVGLVGYPNAGKSTLISRLTAAHPKIGSYPFTTLYPVVGTLEDDQYRRIRIADIPGLIEGAHEGIGLGHDFLRHIERTRFLLILIDMAGVDGRLPHEDYEHVREELRLYRQELSERPFFVVANKMDLPAAEENLQVFVEKTGIHPLSLSALEEDGVDAVREAIIRQVYGSID